MLAPPLSGTAWASATVLRQLYWESTVLAALAPGNYLVRHELLALHQALSPQFYAECAQIVVVSGTGTGTGQRRSPVQSIWLRCPGMRARVIPGLWLIRMRTRGERIRRRGRGCGLGQRVWGRGRNLVLCSSRAWTG